MNNANFGNGCRDNRNNTRFQPIFDEIEEINYIKKYNLFDNNVSKFAIFKKNRLIKNSNKNLPPQNLTIPLEL